MSLLSWLSVVPGLGTDSVLHHEALEVQEVLAWGADFG